MTIALKPGILTASGVVVALVVSNINAAVVPTTDLHLWLDAGVGVTSGVDGVSAWADQSGNGNHVAQADTARQPTLVGSTPDFNNLPTVQFNGSSDVLQAPLSLNPVGGWSIFVAGQHRSAAASKTLLGASNGSYGGSDQYVLLQTSAGAYSYDVNRNSSINLAGTGGTLDTAPHFFSLTYDGTAQTLTYRIDGTTVSTVSALFANMSLTVLDLGAFVHNGNAVGFGDINLAEALVYSAALSSDDRASVDAYLTEKYVVPEPGTAMLALIGGGLLLGRRRSV